MAQLEPYKGTYYLWKYVPSIPAAVIFALLFLLPTLFHIWKICKTRARFCIPFAIGGVFEVQGYIIRAIAHNRTSQLIPYILQNILILLAPVLFAASIYMALGRIIRSVPGGAQHALIRPAWQTKVFVMGDIVSFIVQGSAAGMMGKGEKAGMANNIVIGGLVVQVLLLGGFMVSAVVFEGRVRRAESTGSAGGEDKDGSEGGEWKRHLRVLYVVSALVLVRSVIRVVEYAMGQEGYLLANEWCVYVFDGLLMLVVMVVWGVWHPGSIVNTEGGFVGVDGEGFKMGETSRRGYSAV
ncbi:RTA1 domain-containing protein [Aspergillus candidus]|uniref:RTA1 like protein-domain-containing protein n=1 Tax=Aspergillus candidus TaxID=41067 RepID=A0A2I2FJE3_ASPCN|nr:RTA1 like protein-domain-containing protein [Aspergillus candidus]PLB40757.1 RTA1 like protein-domain-containing protein [Aspergillus candidus]